MLPSPFAPLRGAVRAEKWRDETEFFRKTRFLRFQFEPAILPADILRTCFPYF